MTAPLSGHTVIPASAEDYLTFNAQGSVYAVIQGNGIDDIHDGWSVFYPGGGRFSTCNTEQSAHEDADRMNRTDDKVAILPTTDFDVLFAALDAGKPMRLPSNSGWTIEQQLAYTQRAAHSVAALWDQYQHATTPVTQANIIVEINNAMSDLTSWLPPVEPGE